MARSMRTCTRLVAWTIRTPACRRSGSLAVIVIDGCCIVRSGRVVHGSHKRAGTMAASGRRSQWRPPHVYNRPTGTTHAQRQRKPAQSETQPPTPGWWCSSMHSPSVTPHKPAVRAISRYVNSAPVRRMSTSTCSGLGSARVRAGQWQNARTLHICLICIRSTGCSW